MPTKNPRLDEIHAATSAAIDPRCSISIHPDYIQGFGPTLVGDQPGPGETAYLSTRVAFKSITETISKMQTAHAALAVVQNAPAKHGGRVRSEIPAARRAEVRAAMANAFDRAAHEHARALSTVETSVEHLRDRIDAALKDPTQNTAHGVQTGAEIRAYVAAMEPARRMQFLHEAIREGDKSEVLAVLHASPYVSGLNKKEHALLNTLAEQAWAPTETAQRDACRTLVQHLERAGSILVGKMNELQPPLGDSPQDAALRNLNNG